MESLENRSSRKPQSFVYRLGNNFGQWFSSIFSNPIDQEGDPSKITNDSTFKSSRSDHSINFLDPYYVQLKNPISLNPSANASYNAMEMESSSRFVSPGCQQKTTSSTVNNILIDSDHVDCNNWKLNSECFYPNISRRKRALDESSVGSVASVSTSSTARRIMDQLEALNSAPLRCNLINLVSSSSTRERRRIIHDQNKLNLSYNGKYKISTDKQMPLRDSPISSVDTFEDDSQINDDYLSASRYRKSKISKPLNECISEKSKKFNSFNETSNNVDLDDLSCDEVDVNLKQLSKRPRLGDVSGINNLNDNSESVGSWRCINCEHQNLVGFRFCQLCHTRKDPIIIRHGTVSNQNDTVVLNNNDYIEKVSQPRWRCTFCLIWNDSKKSICIACASSRAIYNNNNNDSSSSTIDVNNVSLVQKNRTLQDLVSKNDLSELIDNNQSKEVENVVSLKPNENKDEQNDPNQFNTNSKLQESILNTSFTQPSMSLSQFDFSKNNVDLSTVNTDESTKNKISTIFSTPQITTLPSSIFSTSLPFTSFTATTEKAFPVVSTTISTLNSLVNNSFGIFTPAVSSLSTNITSSKSNFSFENPFSNPNVNQTNFTDIGLPKSSTFSFSSPAFSEANPISLPSNQDLNNETKFNLSNGNSKEGFKFKTDVGSNFNFGSSVNSSQNLIFFGNNSEPNNNNILKPIQQTGIFPTTNSGSLVPFNTPNHSFSNNLFSQPSQELNNVFDQNSVGRRPVKKATRRFNR